MPRTNLARHESSPSFEDWYAELSKIAGLHGVSVADAEAWRDSYEDGINALSALLDEYPELGHSHSSCNEAFNIDQVAQAIDLPVGAWPGNCYAIACQMLKAQLVDGRAVYGHYLGFVKPGTMFHGKSIVRHGWIETSDGRLVDPTRWVFEGVVPYIYVAALPNPEYDEGGNIFMLKNQRPTPEHDPEKASLEIPNDARELISTLLCRDQVQNRLMVSEAFWLGNLSLIALKERAAPLYAALVAMGQEEVIPIDNRRKILG